MADIPRQPRILIVDDEQINRSLLESRLNFAGYTNLVCAANGQEALNHCDEMLPDLILLDVMMPGIDGYVVTQEIRARFPDDFIPIILVSALRDAENRIRGIEYGANDFLSKPFNSDELVARINSLLALKQAREHSALRASHHQLVRAQRYVALTVVGLSFACRRHQL